MLTCQSFRRRTVCFTEQNVLLKQPIRIECLIKQKPREVLAGKQEREEVGSQLFGSVSIQLSLGNLNGSKPSLARRSCRNKGWRLFLTPGLFWMKYFKLYSLILIPNIGWCNSGYFLVRIKSECDSSCSPYQRHCLCGKILVLWSHDSKGGNNELIVYKNIEHRAIRIIFGPTR